MRHMTILTVSAAMLFAQPSRTTAASQPAPYPCDNGQFFAYQRDFANGTRSTADNALVDVCGRVVRVLPARRTRSGVHGYFEVDLGGFVIEVLANLDAMAEAPANQPPAWPWVAPGRYVYVQGRYFYDAPDRQGIDWTEDDTGRRWPHVGYVAVCDAARGHCTKYW